MPEPAPTDVAHEFRRVERCNLCGDPSARILGKRLDHRQWIRLTFATGIAPPSWVRRCGLIDPNPMPLPVEIGQHHDVEPNVS